MNYLNNIESTNSNSQLMADLDEFDELVKFTLSEYNVDATFRVIIADSKEWNHYFIGYEFYKSFLIAELEWFRDFALIECPEYYEQFVQVENEVQRTNQVEYDHDVSLNDRLNEIDGLTLTLIDSHDFNGIISLELIEKEISTFIKIHAMKKEYEFVILLRENSVLNVSHDEKLTLVAHEAYHIVENKMGEYHSHNFINAKASEIVRKFKNRK